MVLKFDTNVQDAFLTEARDQQTPAVLYTINGFQIRGTIIDFDELTIIVESDGKKQMVYKHALTTVAPFQDGADKEPYRRYKSW